MLNSADIIRAIAQEVARRQERGLPPPTALPQTPLVQPPSVPYSVSSTADDAFRLSRQREDEDIPTRPIDFGTDPEIQAIEERYGEQPEQQPQSFASRLLNVILQAVAVGASRDPGQALQRQIFTQQERARLEDQYKRQRKEEKKDLILKAKLGTISDAKSERKRKQEREMDRLDKLSEQLDRRRERLEDFERQRQLNEIELQAKKLDRWGGPVLVDTSVA